MKKLFKRFILMIQFFTRIPIKVEIPSDNEDFGKGLVFAPIIGLMIGGILLGFYYLFMLFLPLMVTIIFIILLYITITGGLHLDGLADTFDGLFSGRGKERILEIMRDSRIGTFGVLALVGVVLADIGLLASINPLNIPYAILLFPVAGRIGSLLSAGLSSYAREQGLGKSFIDYCTMKEITIGIVIAFIIFYIFLGLLGVAIAFLTHITTLILTLMLTKKLAGATGDILGAVCELNQVAFLIIVLLML